MAIYSHNTIIYRLLQDVQVSYMMFSLLALISKFESKIAAKSPQIEIWMVQLKVYRNVTC